MGLYKDIKKPLRSDWPMFLVRGGVVFINVSSILLMGLLMSPEEFGLFVYQWASILILSSLISFGGHNFLLREMSAHLVDKKNGVSIRFAINLSLLYPLLLLSVFLLIWWSLTYSYGSLIHSMNFSFTEMVLIAMCAFFVNANGHIAIPLRITDRNQSAMIIQDAGPQLLIICAGLVAKLSGNISSCSILALFVVFSFFSFSFGVVWIEKKIPISILFRQDGLSAKYQASFWLSSILGTLASQIDILLAGIYLTPTMLGNYQILKRYANLLSFPQIVANWVVVVDIGKCFVKGNYDKIQGNCARALKISLIPTSILLIIVVLFSPVVFMVYDIRPDVETIASYQILLFASLSSIFFGVNFVVASQCHLERHGVIARIVGVLIIALAILVIGSELNLLYVAIISTISTIITQGYVWFAVVKFVKVDTSAYSLISHYFKRIRKFP